VVAVSQISHRNNDGYAYYQRKRAEGMTKKCALRALKTPDQRHPLPADDR
jgi:hypothetical protein